MSGTNNSKNPFETGVWVMTMIGNRDIVAMVDGTSLLTGEEVERMEDALKAEMQEHRSVCVVLSKKYIFYQVSFPIRTQNNGFAPANLAVVGKHEIILEFENEFPTYANLQLISFVSELHEEDIERLRSNIMNAEEGAKEYLRSKRSNIVTPR